MEQFEINAEPRSDVGKGASRRLRRSGKIPGIIYGTKKDAMPITIGHNEIIHQLENEAFYSHILTVKVGKGSEKVVLKDLQRHPYKPHILHIDFQRIDEKEKLTMRIPLHFINESSCIGVKQGGGVISRIMTELEVTCLPKDLPEFIDVDMEQINLGETVQLGDLVMPEGVAIYALQHGGNPALPIVSVHMPRVSDEEEVEVAEEVVDEVTEAPVDDTTAEAED